MTMIGEIITAAVDVALLAAFALILGAFAVLLWDLFQGRIRGWLRVMAVAVLAPACALAATVISAGVGLTLASALKPDQPPAKTEPAEQDVEQTSPNGGAPRRPPRGRRPPPPRPPPPLQPRPQPHPRLRRPPQRRLHPSNSLRQSPRRWTQLPRARLLENAYESLKAAFLALLATFQPAALTSLRSRLLTLDTYSHVLHSMGDEAANAIG